MQSTDLYGIKGSCFDIKLEYNSEFVIVHLPAVQRMNKSTVVEMKIMLRDWVNFFKAAGYRGIHVAAPDGDKIHKLIHMLDFTYIGRQSGMLVYQYTGEE
jgi:hypothetical protein